MKKKVIHGFEVVREAGLADQKIDFIELKDPRTGARWIHLGADDTENVFAVAFKTVPADSTGVAHILEHLVLAGSEKYPISDPFSEMGKRSLNTFMNAFTGSDWTAYPFASENEKDFYNLMDMYLDAVFFPLLSELNFRREGWRLEFKGKDLVYNGVVYNEMKGAMVSSSQIVANQIMKSLMPSGPYAHNAGGNPAVIPNLTHAQLKAFHARHYHPSNATFFSYGNFPLGPHLKTVREKALRRFKRTDPCLEVAPEPRRKREKRIRVPFPLSGHENPERKHQACLSWLAAPVEDTFNTLTLLLLSDILLGNPAAPLRRALSDSGLGSDLADASGFFGYNDLRETVFSVGLKGIGADDAPRVKRTVLRALRKIADEGIDAEMIESSLHRIELQRKEVARSQSPRGLDLIEELIGVCQHGGDALSALDIGGDLEKLKKKLAENGSFLESKIREFLLDNRHRVFLSLYPDQAMLAREEERESARLAETRKKMLNPEEARIRKMAHDLEEQEERQKDLSCLPSLELSDVPPLVKRVSCSVYEADPDIAGYVQPTNGLVYFSGAFDASAVPEELSFLIPFLCYALPQIGTKRRNYAEQVKIISRYTGGIHFGFHAETNHNGDDPLFLVTVRGKALAENTGKMFDAVAEMLAEHDFKDLKRLKALLLEYLTRFRTGLVRQGHAYAMQLAERGLSRVNLTTENWGGILQLKFIQGVANGLSADGLGNLAGAMDNLGKMVFGRSGLKMAVTGQGESLPWLSAGALGVKTSLPRNEMPRVTTAFSPLTVREGWITATAESFAAMALPAAGYTHPDAPALSVAAAIMRDEYLEGEIRRKGGAYGAGASYDRTLGAFTLWSYRDPSILPTLTAFRKAFDYLKSKHYGETETKNAILSVCSGLDRPASPSTLAYNDFFRKIIGLSDDNRQRFKEAVLSVKPADVRRVCAEHLTPDRIRDSSIAVISNKEKLEEAKKELVDMRIYEI